MSNPDPLPRHGNVMLVISGKVVSTSPIIVNSEACTYSVNPSTIHFGSAGGIGKFTVSADPSDCVPDASTTFSYDDASNPAYTVTIPPNFGPPLTGTILFGSSYGVASGANATLTVAQDGVEGNGAFVVECPLTGIPRVGSIPYIAATFPAICYAGGGTEPYSWSVNDARVSVSPVRMTSTGISDSLPPGPYQFTVKATDSSSPIPHVATYTLKGVIAPALPSFVCSYNPDQSQAGSSFGIACIGNGGTPPYQWSIGSGALPSGVTLSSADAGRVAISGTPGSAGDYAFTLLLTDSTTPMAMQTSQAFTGTILPSAAAPAPFFASCTTVSFTIEIGMPMPPNLCIAIGGLPPYYWSVHSGAMPGGLALSTPVGSSMMIVGTPTTSTYYPYYLKLTDSSPNPQSIIWTQSYSIANPLGIYCTGKGPSLIGESYFVECTPSGGIGLLSTWISAGALPAGLTTSRGFIQGTPTTPGPYSYTISVEDGLTPTPATVSQTFKGVIGPLPVPLDLTNVSGSMAHLAIGDGWSTTTVLMNPGASYAQAHVGYFGDGGTPLLFPLSTSAGTVTSASAADQIVAAHSMFEVDSAAQAGDPLQEGSANVSSDGDVNGFIRFHYAPRDQDATVPLETRKAAAYLLSFDDTNGIATGVALANLSASAANVPVLMRDDSGAQIGSASLPLAAKGHTAFVLSDKFPNLANQRGTIEFDTPAAGRISVLGLRFPPGQQFTTIPVIASSDAGGGSLAHLAVGNGWTSTIELVNFGATTAQAHLKFFGDDGGPLPLALAFATTTATTATVDQPIAPHSRVVIQSTALDSDPLQIGSAQLTTDGSVSGFIRFRYGPRNQEAIVPLESRNSSSYIVAFDNTNGLAAGVAVANLSANALSIPVIIRDSSGAQLGSGVVTLAANGHSAFVLSDQFAAAANQTGTVEFDAPAGSQISVLGLRFPASGAFSTIPVVTP